MRRDGGREPMTGWRAAGALAALAAGVRLVVLGCTVAGGAVADRAVTLADMARLHDGREYLMVAEALGSRERTAALPAEARRLGVGYPVLIRSASTLVPPHVAALAVAVLGAAAATALLALLGLPVRAVALFAVLTPSWVAFSATAMSEGPFVALLLAGLVAWRRGTPGGDLAAGLLFGAAVLVRPVGAVVFAALWLVRLGSVRRGPSSGDAVVARTVVPVAAFALPVAVWAAGTLVGHGAGGQVGTYLARDLALPFASLLEGFAHPGADPLKWLQNVAVLALVATTAWMLARRVRTERGSARREASEWLAWSLSQLGFYLVLPSAWVFECLARFLVPTLPAVTAALAPRVPRVRWRFAVLVGAVAAVSVGVSVLWNLRALGVLA